MDEQLVYVYSPDRMSRNTWYRRVLRSIMPPSARFKLQQFVVDPLKARNAKSSKYPEMNPQTRNKLLKHYAPHNKVLSELIARDLTHWSKYVLGIDIVEHYIEQANFVKGALDLEQVEFKVMDIDSVDESIVGLFDITFCFGILYHLRRRLSSFCPKQAYLALTRSRLALQGRVLDRLALLPW